MIALAIILGGTLVGTVLALVAVYAAARRAPFDRVGPVLHAAPYAHGGRQDHA